LHRGILLGKNTNRNGQTVDFYYTGCMMDNTITTIGHRRYKILLPNGAGNYSGWTGAGYTAVDEPPPHDGASTVNTLSGAVTLNMQSCADVGLTAGDTIKLYKPLFYTMKVSGSCNLALRLRVSGTDYTSTIGNPGNSQFYQFGYVWELNPFTAAAWAQSEIDSAEMGPVWSSGTVTPTVTAVWGLVEYEPDPSPAPPSTAEHVEMFV
jgi:hypothetical protein